MMWNETQVSLNFCLFKGPLILKRVPKYLRFVCKRDGTDWKWDALDQLDDVPEADEEVMAAIQTDRVNVHLDRRVNGKHVGEWHSTAMYELVDEQPDDSVLRDTELWRKYCGEMEAKHELAGKGNADHSQGDSASGNVRHEGTPQGSV